MTSRERVLLSLNHQEPDRVPIDFNSHRSSGISVTAYKRLREYLGLKPSPLFIYDVLQQLAIVEEDILDLFGVDVVQLGCEYHKDPAYWSDWEMHDGTLCKIPSFIKIDVLDNGDYSINGEDGEQLCIQKRNCLYFEQTAFPLAGSEDRSFIDLKQQLQRVMWVKVGTPPEPNGFDSNGIKKRKAEAQALRKLTDRAIYATFGGNLMELGEQCFRMDNFLLELAADPERIEVFLDKLLEIHMQNLEAFIKEIGPHIDIIGFGDDLGMQTSAQISEEMFCRFFKPRYARMWQYVKQQAPHLKINLHCCGSIYNLIPHLAEVGLDAINPVQITCENMEPWRLKRDYGDIITFWGGGCDTRYALPKGSQEEIEKNVRENVAALKGNGGFVFQQVHNILADVPPENIVTMFNSIARYGNYGKY